MLNSGKRKWFDHVGGGIPYGLCIFEINVRLGVSAKFDTAKIKFRLIILFYFILFLEYQCHVEIIAADKFPDSLWSEIFKLVGQCCEIGRIYFVHVAVVHLWVKIRGNIRDCPRPFKGNGRVCVFGGHFGLGKRETKWRAMSEFMCQMPPVA